MKYKKLVWKWVESEYYNWKGHRTECGQYEIAYSTFASDRYVAMHNDRGGAYRVNNVRTSNSLEAAMESCQRHSNKMQRRALWVLTGQAGLI